jgi:segregation and condensation protein A
MTMSSLAYQASKYMVNTSVYEGPLDLLLQLIERAELDITKLALAQVTDQYLEHLHSIEECAPEEVSTFLVIAARLLQIKSNALLPRPPVYDEFEEDPGEALAQQLRIYKRYKEIASILLERCEQGYRTYLRISSPLQLATWIDLGDLDLTQFVMTAQIVFNRDVFQTSLDTVVPNIKITIREKISLIRARLSQHDKASFQTLLNRAHSRVDVVVTFLAVLELVKRHLLRVTQQSIFGEIILESEESWGDNIDIEAEFGD